MRPVGLVGLQQQRWSHNGGCYDASCVLDGRADFRRPPNWSLDEARIALEKPNERDADDDDDDGGGGAVG